MELPSWLVQGIDTYGYWVVLLAVALESTGIPFPGETTLVAGSVYASTHHSLNIVLVIAAAAAGAILGDNFGYTIGYYGGYPLLMRILRLLHIGDDKLLYTQRFFAQHGDKTVFFGRFLAVLRTWAAFLAGANRMRRRTFIIWNAAGGILWATLYGLLGYLLGDNLPLLGRILKDLGILGFGLLGMILVALGVAWWLRRRRVHASMRAFARGTDAESESASESSVAVSSSGPRRASSSQERRKRANN